MLGVVLVAGLVLCRWAETSASSGANQIGLSWYDRPSPFPPVALALILGPRLRQVPNQLCRFSRQLPKHGVERQRSPAVGFDAPLPTLEPQFVCLSVDK